MQSLKSGIVGMQPLSALLIPREVSYRRQAMQFSGISTQI
jgi:hypothetical protein